jgi:hypothetical protein
MNASPCTGKRSRAEAVATLIGCGAERMAGDAQRDAPVADGGSLAMVITPETLEPICNITRGRTDQRQTRPAALVSRLGMWRSLGPDPGVSLSFNRVIAHHRRPSYEVKPGFALTV